jgi:hypothetical protein
MALNASCIVPLLIGLFLLVLFLTIVRRIVFVADEVALLGLIYSGLREVLGGRRVATGTLMILALAVGFVVFIVLIAMSASTCLGASPSAFCTIVTGPAPK